MNTHESKTRTKLLDNICTHLEQRIIHRPYRVSWNQRWNSYWDNWDELEPIPCVPVCWFLRRGYVRTKIWRRQGLFESSIKKFESILWTENYMLHVTQPKVFTSSPSIDFPMKLTAVPRNGTYWGSGIREASSRKCLLAK